MAASAVVAEGFGYQGAFAIQQAAATTFTFTDVALGPESPGRHVALFIAARGSSANRTITSVLLDGVPVQQDVPSPGGWYPATAHRKWLPTGTTATVVVTLDVATSTECSLMVYTFENKMALSIGFAGAVPGAVAESLVNATATVATTPGSTVLAFAAHFPAAGVWTSGVSEIGRQTIGSFDYTLASAIGTGADLTATTSTAGVGVTMVMLSYREVPAGELITDSFDRASSTSTLRACDTGQVWQQWGTGRAVLTNNQAYRGTSNATAMVDFGQSDMYVSHKVAVTGSYFAGPCARMVDLLNGYNIDTQSNGLGIRIYRDTTALGSVPLGGILATFVVGDRIGLRAKEEVGGTRLTAYKNDIEVGSWLDTEPTRPFGTFAGINPYNNTSIRLDDFRVDAGDRPAFLPGWMTWLEGSTLPASGVAASWPSLVPGGRNAVATDGVGSGTVTTSATSTGSKALAFDPASDSAQVAGYAFPALLSPSAEGEVWMVVKSRGSTFGSWKFGVNDQRNHYPYSTTVYDDTGSAGRHSFTPNMSITSLRVYRILSTAAGIKIWIDGVLNGQVDGISPSWTQYPLLGRSSGAATSAAHAALADYGFMGDIAFCAVRDRETTGADLTAMYTYLKATTGAGP